MRRKAFGWMREGILLLAALMIAGALCWFGFDRYYRSAYPLQYTEYIDAACEKKGLDRAFVYAVVRSESSFRPRAESQAGAKGLMQMMPAAYDWIRMRKGLEPDDNPEALFDPQTNVEYGTSMLRLLFDEFGSESNVLCAYHAGRGNLQSWLEDPEYAPDGRQVEQIPFPDTRAYVSKVIKTAEIYRRLYNL